MFIPPFSINILGSSDGVHIEEGHVLLDGVFDCGDLGFELFFHDAEFLEIVDAGGEIVDPPPFLSLRLICLSSPSPSYSLPP